MSEIQFASLSSVFVLGGFIGAMTSGPLSTKRGKLFVMRLSTILFTLGSVIQTVAGSVLLMQVGRLVVGLASGAATVIVPLYVAELAPPSQKGFFGSFTQVSINLGILITQSFGYFLSKNLYWRWIMSVGAFMGLIRCVGMVFAVETPVWLAVHEDSAKAREVLRRIRGHGYDVTEETRTWKAGKRIGQEDGTAEEEGSEPLLRRPSNTSSDIPAAHVSLYSVVTDPQYRPALIAVVGILLVQQFTGINGIMLYSVSLLKGVLPVSSSALTIVISCFNLGSTLALSSLPDRIGRKPTLLISVAGMGLSSLGLAFSLVFGLQYLSAVSVILFVVFFATGLGPVPFSMASEMVHENAVGPLQSCGLGASYFGTFIVAQFFPVFNSFLNDKFGGIGWIFFFFFGTGMLSVLFVVLKVPETRGKSVEEVWGKAPLRQD